MSVFDAMARMKRYISNCPTVGMKDAARQDFSNALREVIDKGYTWGRHHQLPFEVDDIRRMPKKDLYKMIKMLENAKAA